MKTKILSIIIAIIAIFTIFTVAYAEKVPDSIEAVSEEYSESASDEVVDGAIEFIESNFGDVNEDGKRNAADARLLLRVSAQLDNVSAYILTYGDYNRDNQITASDARTALRVSAMLENIECILHGHNMIEKIIEPTCTEDGYTTDKCSRCTYSDDLIINKTSATGHIFTSKTVKATCTTDGYTEYKCSACGAVEKRDITKAGGHHYTTLSSVIKSYGPVIREQNKKCSVCGKTITTYSMENADMQIETKLFSSADAKAIVSKFDLPRSYQYIEGYDITGTKVVVYDDIKGVDIDGYCYNLNGTLKGFHSVCARPLGVGENMCDGFCNISWSGFGSESSAS